MVAVDPEAAASGQPAVLPGRPMKQVAFVTGAPVTRTVTVWAGTDQSRPERVRYGASWRPKRVVAAATV